MTFIVVLHLFSTIYSLKERLLCVLCRNVSSHFYYTFINYLKMEEKLLKIQDTIDHIRDIVGAGECTPLEDLPDYIKQGVVDQGGMLNGYTTCFVFSNSEKPSSVLPTTLDMATGRLVNLPAD